ncbi:MAG: TRAP transporter substrate-binding protein [Desulfobacterales bacterium]|nr:MAG: TRAP transporter substrate-binding protein [Desulfobacterales bacterium]
MKKKFLLLSLSLAVLINLTLAFPNLNPPAFAADVIQLKFANYFPPPAPHSKICEDFIAELEKRTDGRVKVQYFAGGSLLKATSMYEGVVTGIADIGLAHVEYTPGRFPVTEICDLPLGYPSGWVSNQVVNDFYENFKPKEWDKVHILWMHASNPNVVISKKPVYNLDDMRGLTLRAPGRVGDTIKALGATPAPTPIMETYDGIAKGVLDGVNTPYETLRTFRFAEVAKYVTTSWQVGNLYTFYVAMNKDSYKKFPPDIKAIFDKLCGEYKERMALMWNSIDFAGKNFAAEKGVEFIDLDSAEAKKWKQATAPIIEDYVKKMVSSGYSEDEVRGWLKYLDERIEYWTQKQIALFIKSPTGPPEIRP